MLVSCISVFLFTCTGCSYFAICLSHNNSFMHLIFLFSDGDMFSFVVGSRVMYSLTNHLLAPLDLVHILHIFTLRIFISYLQYDLEMPFPANHHLLACRWDGPGASSPTASAFCGCTVTVLSGYCRLLTPKAACNALLTTSSSSGSKALNPDDPSSEKSSSDDASHSPANRARNSSGSDTGERNLWLLAAQ